MSTILRHEMDSIMMAIPKEIKKAKTSYLRVGQIMYDLKLIKKEDKTNIPVIIDTYKLHFKNRLKSAMRR